MFTHELVNKFDLISSLPPRLIFLGVKTKRPGVVERSPVAIGRRTHQKAHGFKNLCRLLSLWTARGHAVEHDYGIIAGVLDEFNGRGDRLEVIDCGAAWKENKFGRSCGSHGGLLRPRRRIDQKQICTLFSSRIENVPKPRRLSRDDHGRSGLTAIAPFARTRLRVKVDDGDRAPSALGGDGQGYSQCGFFRFRPSGR